MENQALLQATLVRLRMPVFLVNLNTHKSELKVHVCGKYDRASLRAQTDSIAANVGPSIRVAVCGHRLHKLAHPRSLEHWFSQFEVDKIVYDPTMVVSRVEALLRTGRSCRLYFGDAIKGLFIDLDRRVLFVLVHDKINGVPTSTLRQRVTAVIQQTFNEATAEPDTPKESWATIQVVSELPHRKLIPVDAKSASRVHNLGRVARKWLAPLALAAAVAGFAVPAAANINPQDAGGALVNTYTAKTKGHSEVAFGILQGLSVFRDEVRHELDAFALEGLRQYFSDKSHATKGIRIAEKDRERRRRHREPELGQVGGGGPAAPGS